MDVARDLRMESKADHVLAYLHERGFEHLRVRLHGKLVVIESGPEDDVIPHARLRKDTVNYWKLEMPVHGGRWEPTGIRAFLDDVLEILVTDFPWTLTPIA